MGEVDDADVIFRVGYPSCGDMLPQFLKFDNELVADVKCRILGCRAASGQNALLSLGGAALHKGIIHYLAASGQIEQGMRVVELEFDGSVLS
ncbi:MAG: hypothetical protein EG822_17915 [Deltaproteobacteria bacterium]|nr:hypothetical protein [Deltaproteobacteria bacterium]